MTVLEPLPVRFGRETCGELQRAEALEWLVTNGIGGFASGTVAGIRTRRYHGILVAALDPPAARTVMVTDVHEALQWGEREARLHASRWRDGSVSPSGFVHTEAFWLEGSVPVWRFCIGDVCLEKRLAMAGKAFGERELQFADPIALLRKTVIEVGQHRAMLVLKILARRGDALVQISQDRAMLVLQILSRDRVAPTQPTDDGEQQQHQRGKGERREHCP